MMHIIDRKDWADSPEEWKASWNAPLETIDIHASGRFITQWLE
jgi:hypothetical protein